MYGSKWGIEDSPIACVGQPQSLVLLFSKLKPYAAAANFESVIDYLTRFEIEFASPTLRCLEQLLRVVEYDSSRQGRLQIFLKKLAMPSLPKHEAHVDTVTATVGASLLTGSVRRRQRASTDSTDLPSQPLPNH
jgi:hypothetical protein